MSKQTVYPFKRQQITTKKIKPSQQIEHRNRIIMDDHQQIPMILTVIHGQNGQGAKPLQSIKP